MTMEITRTNIEKASQQFVLNRKPESQITLQVFQVAREAILFSNGNCPGSRIGLTAQACR